MNFELVNKTVCLCGKRHSGKSELIKYIVSLYGHQFNKIFVICPSEAVNKFYSQFLPSENIFNDYSDERINKLMTRLIKINVKKIKNIAKDNTISFLPLIINYIVIFIYLLNHF
jgi:energy-coupling factor transporter ATP-binding protein EcfA2